MKKITNTKNKFKELKELIKNSYSPYSKFATAAIVHTDKGDFKGINVENISEMFKDCRALTSFPDYSKW